MAEEINRSAPTSTTSKGIDLPGITTQPFMEHRGTPTPGRKAGTVRTIFPWWLNPKTLIAAALGLISLGSVVISQNHGSQEDTPPTPQTAGDPANPTPPLSPYAKPRLQIERFEAIADMNSSQDAINKAASEAISESYGDNLKASQAKQNNYFDAAGTKPPGNPTPAGLPAEPEQTDEPRRGK